MHNCASGCTCCVTLLLSFRALDLHGNCIEAPSKSVLTLCQYIPCDFSPGTQCSSGSNLGFAPPSATLSYGDILAISVIASLLAGLFCVFFVLNKIPWEKIAIKLGLKKPQRVEMLQLSPNHRRRSGKRSTRSTLRSHDSREESRGEHQLSIPDELMERGSRSEGSPPPPSGT